MNFNSLKNQTIKREFVEREVHSCVTTEVEFILSTAYLETPVEPPYTIDDIKNYYVDKSNEIEELENEIACLKEILKEILEGEDEVETTLMNEIEIQISEKEDQIDDLRREEQEPQAIFEWWKVTPYLAKKLTEWGAPVIEDYNLWGRTCTGQSISLDEVISYICKEAKLLVED